MIGSGQTVARHAREDLIKGPGRIATPGGGRPIFGMRA